LSGLVLLLELNDGQNDEDEAYLPDFSSSWALAFAGSTSVQSLSID